MVFIIGNAAVNGVGCHEVGGVQIILCNNGWPLPIRLPLQ